MGRLLAGWGWRHSVDPRLDEFDFGTWDGRPWAEVSRDEIDTWGENFATHRVGGGESVAELLGRCRAFMAEQGDCCVVGHAGWISAACWLQANSDEAPRASTWPVALGYGGHITLC